jgi:predicted O-linked N-acetylglucosamine transferase (SPINDLY family)
MNQRLAPTNSAPPEIDKPEGTIAAYEAAIAADPTLLTNYWHLGLAQLLQGNEVDAQATWMSAFMAVEDEAQAAQVTQDLSQILHQAAHEQAVDHPAMAWTIRQHLREIAPQDLDNLFQLIRLSIQLDNLSDEDLEDWNIAEVLRSGPATSLANETVADFLRTLLDYFPPTPAVLAIIAACGQAIANPTALLLVLLHAATKIAYTYPNPLLASSLIEEYLAWDPANVDAWTYVASLYLQANCYEKGIPAAQRCFELSQFLPDQIFSQHLLLRGLMGAGGFWHQAMEIYPRQEELLLQFSQHQFPPNSIDPGRLLLAGTCLPYLRDNFRQQRAVQNAVAQQCQAVLQARASESVARYQARHYARQPLDRPLRIGYLSHCFYQHSVGWLARWLIQHHDPQRVQTYCYFINPRHQDDLQTWYLERFDHTYTHVVNSDSDTQAIAEQIFQDEIDILIDLDSTTLDATCKVMALKPAPIQVTWLGWDASGLPAIDYFIADPYVLTDDAPQHYREKIWRLPQTYIAVDGFEVGVPSLRRDQLEIPPDAIVYLSAQRAYKRHPDTVRLQLEILQQVPNSYFLIKGIADDAQLQRFFYEMADAVGVSRDRLRFLPLVPLAAVHRANFAIADVVLDTFPYNGATTTLEALWMERPLVTRVGEQFAARNSYTMLKNVGIDVGIAWSDTEYIDWGVRLGTDPNLRQQVAWQLRQAKQHAPLWNARAFTRQMEDAYSQMWDQFIATRSSSGVTLCSK